MAESKLRKPPLAAIVMATNPSSSARCCTGEEASVSSGGRRPRLSPTQPDNCRKLLCAHRKPPESCAESSDGPGRCPWGPALGAGLRH